MEDPTKLFKENIAQHKVQNETNGTIIETIETGMHYTAGNSASYATARGELLLARVNPYNQESGYSEPNVNEEEFNSYELMRESIETYGGFYVARYELGKEGTDDNIAAVVKKYKQCYTKQDLTQNNDFNKVCQSLAKGNAVVSSAIWGCQWDATCLWIAQDGSYDIYDSNSWGNYQTSTENAAVPGEYGAIKPTGFSEYWKAKNIYDLAGNGEEFTQEKKVSATSYPEFEGYIFDISTWNEWVRYTKYEYKNVYRGGSSVYSEKMEPSVAYATESPSGTSENQTVRATLIVIP